MNKRSIIRQTSLLALLILALPLGALAQVKVLSLKGRVSFGKNPVRAGQVLQGLGTLAALGVDSYVDVEFPGGHVTRLRDGALVLKKVEPRATLLSLARGQIFSVIKRLKGRASYQVETAGAVAGVRGTKLFFEEGPNQSYVCVCEGKIDLKKTGAAATDKARQVPSGQEVFTPRGGDLGPTQKASKDKLAVAEKEFKELGFPVDKSQW